MIATEVTEIGSSTTRLTGAILLYSGEQTASNNLYGPNKYQFATVNNIQFINDVPQIMPGRAITEKDLEILSEGLLQANTRASTVRWIDPAVLAQGPDRMIWWTPPTRRAMYFKKSPHGKDTFDGANVCAVPGLVWVAFPGRALYVYAVKGASRPTVDTQLFQAPFFNVWGRGQVCVGNATLPSENELWETAAWERFFMASHFTHPNFTQKDRLIKKQSPVRFWRKMVETPVDTFPEKVLVQVQLNVQDLMVQGFTDLLNSRIKKPVGEF